MDNPTDTIIIEFDRHTFNMDVKGAAESIDVALAMIEQCKRKLTLAHSVAAMQKAEQEAYEQFQIEQLTKGIKRGAPQ